MAMSSPHDMRPLAGRVAVVTGASRGIGAAVAKRLAHSGAHVVLIARTIGGLEEVDDAIRSHDGTATLMPMDLLSLDLLDNLGPTLHHRFGRLDILVANAAMLGGLGPVAHMEPKVWDKTITLNLTVNQRLIRTLDPLLRASDAGRAVFVTSGLAHKPLAYWGPYAASKAGLEMMVQIYAAEVAKTSLRVNLIDPGNVATALRAQAFPGEDPATLKQPDDVVNGFLDLVTPSCRQHGAIIKA